MSIKSTHYITRKTTIKVIKSKLEYCTNEELAEMLESLPDNTFRNFRVYDRKIELPNEEYIQDRVIHNINEY